MEKNKKQQEYKRDLNHFVFAFALPTATQARVRGIFTQGIFTQLNVVLEVVRFVTKKRKVIYLAVHSALSFLKEKINFFSFKREITDLTPKNQRSGFPVLPLSLPHLNSPISYTTKFCKVETQTPYKSFFFSRYTSSIHPLLKGWNGFSIFDFSWRGFSSKKCFTSPNSLCSTDILISQNVRDAGKSAKILINQNRTPIPPLILISQNVTLPTATQVYKTSFDKPTATQARLNSLKSEFFDEERRGPSIVPNIRTKICKAKNVIKPRSSRKLSLSELRKRGKIGFIYLTCTKNNTICTLIDPKGGTKGWNSSGTLGFKNARKSTIYAAQGAAEMIGVKAKGLGFKRACLIVKGLGRGKESSVRTLRKSGLKILSVEEKTPIPHNGCRPPKKRRV